MAEIEKIKAPRNRSLSLTKSDKKKYRSRLMKITAPVSIDQITDRTICQDIYDVIEFLPVNSVDLLIADPPYNLTRKFSNNTFRATDISRYREWLDSWIGRLPRIMKKTGSLYICGDWRSSPAIFFVLQKYFTIRNRITWEREKGRGAKGNWKNAHEDIWFATVSDDYTFNLEAVKVKRRVLAPYKQNGQPKDWDIEARGNYRLTHPSNLWNDITVPFWSMPENTDHPTQKPEKLLAKLILASSDKKNMILDPFLGSGTTSVVARKLGRHYIGIEKEEEYCLLAEKRVAQADKDRSIQGYSDGIFWERNSQKK